MSRKRPTLALVPAAPVAPAPREFVFIVRTGDVDAGNGARLTDGVLTIRAGDSLATQLGAIEQAIRYYTDRPNELRAADRPAQVTG